ncbi:Uncharacterised protein [Yersinia pekkanenii]|uniref:Uncharacterized protein n=1 Tax=Yersinia pekkanenii TaxID=1288385 RepID=A0A0T9R1Q4_9GAMM|nr:Uncharacterised protein [Yersinia pekkanenii]
MGINFLSVIITIFRVITICYTRNKLIYLILDVKHFFLCAHDNLEKRPCRELEPPHMN